MNRVMLFIVVVCAACTANHAHIWREVDANKVVKLRGDYAQSISQLNVKEPTRNRITQLYNAYVAQTQELNKPTSELEADDKSWVQCRGKQRELALKLEADIASTLDDRERNKWAAYCRETQRQRVLPELGSLGHNGDIDLIAVLSGMTLEDSERERVALILPLYENDLSAVLNDWEAQCDELMIRFYEMQSSKTANMASREAELAGIRQRFGAMAGRLKEISDRYLTEISSCLEEGNRQAFQMCLQSRAHPELYKQGPVDVIVEMVQQDTSLEEAVRGAIISTYHAYCIRRSDLRQRYIRTIAHWESPGEVQRRKRLCEELVANGQPITLMYRGNPVARHIVTLVELERRTCAELRSLIGAEKLEVAPIEVRLLLTLW